jgi:Domain of unknown function (DUF4124)
MNKSCLLVIGAAVSVAFCISAEAKLYKWVDSQGVTHYGETIPPEYANRKAQELDNGRLTNRDETFDTRKIKKSSEETPEQKAALEAKRRDEALLNSYTTVKEIDLSRDRNLSQINARLSSYGTLLKSAQATMQSLNDEKDARIKKGQKIPKSLTDDMATAQSRIADLQQALSDNEREKETIKAKYAADKKRFMELKGLAPMTPPDKK